MATTLVTGGAGFVGLAVVEKLLGLGENVVAFDVIDVPPDAQRQFSALAGRLVTLSGSVLDPAALLDAVRTHKVGAIVHAAAVTTVTSTEKLDALTVGHVNYIGTLNVLEIARQFGLRLVHLSTSGVYGAIQDRPGFAAATVVEDTLPDPRSLYAISKTAAEQTVLTHMDLFGLDAIVARIGVTWGPWEYETGSRHVLSAPLQLLRLASAGQPAVIGRESIKDWSYSRNAAHAVALLKERQGQLRSRVFNVSGDSEWPVTHFASSLAAAYPGFTWRLAASPDEPDVNVRLSKASDRQPLDVARLKTEAGFNPVFGVDESFEDYVSWARRSTCWQAPQQAAGLTTGYR